MEPSQLQNKIDACLRSGGGRPGSLTSLLEKALGRELTVDEADDVQAAIEERDEALQAANNAFKNSVSQTLQISVEELDAKVRAYLDSRRGEGEGRGGGRR